MSITVKRANVILDISPDDKAHYMSQGFSVIDKDGRVTEQSQISDPAELQAQVLQLQKELAKYKKQVKDLKGSKEEDPEGSKKEK
jgi:hypothetical protein